ncbi:MAG: branched-chain amino acid ABC transporter permease [Sulfolobales archaeon]
MILDVMLNTISSLGIFFVIYSLLALSLNIELGYGGISNFGKVAFYAIGAFTTGALATRIALWMFGKSFDIASPINPYVADPFKLATVNQYISYITLNKPEIAMTSYFISMIVAVLLAGLFGLLATYPALRLKIDYLGITLLVFGEIIRNIGNNYETLVAGPHSMSVPKPFSWLVSLGLPSYLPDLIFFILGLALLYIVYILLGKMLNSPYGRSLKAMRDDELAAMSLGKDLAKLKAQALVIGSAIAGLAGSLYVGYTGSISAGEYIPFITFIVWTMVLMGGSGNNLGSLVGAAVWVGIDRSLRLIKDLIPSLPFATDYLRYMLTGVIIVSIILYRPNGLIPEREVKTPAWTVLRVSSSDKSS